MDESVNCVKKPLQVLEHFYTEITHGLAIMRIYQGEEDDRMSAMDTDTLILLIITWLPMLWFSRPPKHP